MKLLQRKRRMSKWLVPGSFLFLAVGGGVFFFCGLHSVSGKYLYQESRIDVIHTAEFGNDSEAAAEEETNMEPDENIFFSDGSTWESEELFSDFVCETAEKDSPED